MRRTYTFGYKPASGPPCPRCGKPTIKFTKIADYDDIGCTSAECRIVWRLAGADKGMGNDNWRPIRKLSRECWTNPAAVMAAIIIAAIER